MKKGKGMFVPGKKTIKKPKFILEFAVCLAVCLTVSSFLTNKYLEKRRVDAIGMLDEEYRSNSENVAGFLGLYADAKEIENSDSYVPEMAVDDNWDELEASIYIYGMITGEYGVAYIGRTEVMRVPTGYYAAIRFNQYADKPQGVLILEDDSYMAPLTTYKDGKYDPVENAKRVARYRAEGGQMESYARLGWVPKIYDIYWETIYVNEETRRFLPGKVKIVDYFKDEDIDEIDLTPQDTKGYTLVETDDDLQMWLHGYVDPKKTEEPFSEMICAAGRGGGESMEKYWPLWNFRTTQTYLYSQSVFEVLPITSRVMWIQDMLAAVLLALVISVIWYQRKKYIWRIFEYRKSTTEAMAHDLKTPLAAISMYAECMEEQPEKTGEYTGKIRENVSEMNQMLEKILSFSKSEGGGNTIARSAVDMEKLIRETISKYDGLFAKNKIEVKVYKQEDCVIKTDENTMRQTIENLLSNCAKYAEPESEVRIFITAGKLEFSNKTSLSDVNVEDLKKPFVKGDTSRGENGTGLGLAIVDNNLKILGYKLDLELEEGWFTANVLLK